MGKMKWGEKILGELKTQFKVGDVVTVTASPQGPIQTEEMIRHGVITEIKTGTSRENWYRVENDDKWGLFAEADLKLDK